MKAIKRAYSTSGGGANMEELSELYFGSIEEREALANAITAKGVDTNVTNSLLEMAENINNIKNGFIGTLKATSSGLTSNTWYSTATIDIRLAYPNYQNITIDNISVQIPSFTTINGATLSLSYTYNSSTGTITIKSTGGGNNALWLPSSISSFNAKVAIVA